MQRLRRIDPRSVHDRASRQLSELATRARPELLILHQPMSRASDELMREMRAVYRGRFLIGHDLDVF